MTCLSSWHFSCVCVSFSLCLVCLCIVPLCVCLVHFFLRHRHIVLPVLRPVPFVCPPGLLSFLSLYISCIKSSNILSSSSSIFVNHHLTPLLSLLLCSAEEQYISQWYSSILRDCNEKPSPSTNVCLSLFPAGSTVFIPSSVKPSNVLMTPWVLLNYVKTCVNSAIFFVVLFDLLKHENKGSVKIVISDDWALEERESGYFCLPVGIPLLSWLFSPRNCVHSASLSLVSLTPFSFSRSDLIFTLFSFIVKELQRVVKESCLVLHLFHLQWKNEHLSISPVRFDFLSSLSFLLSMFWFSWLIQDG